eukprot:scaffold197_cov220-Prasinococcus_capsulatus_cf.AAC.4
METSGLASLVSSFGDWQVAVGNTSVSTIWLVADIDVEQRLPLQRNLTVASQPGAPCATQGVCRLSPAEGVPLADDAGLFEVGGDVAVHLEFDSVEIANFNCQSGCIVYAYVPLLALSFDGYTLVRDNSAMANGAVVAVAGDGSVSLAAGGNATITSNMAHGRGGVAFVDGAGPVNIAVVGDAILDNNYASGNGGVVSREQNCQFCGTTGGLSLEVKENGAIKGNRAEGGGGVIFSGCFADVSLVLADYAVIAGNYANSGGVVNACAWGAVSLQLDGNAAIMSNWAWGGGVVVTSSYPWAPLDFSLVTRDNAKVAYNHAHADGGVVNAVVADVALVLEGNSTVANNYAEGNGGVVWGSSSGVSLSLDGNATITDNHASDGGVVALFGDCAYWVSSLSLVMNGTAAVINNQAQSRGGVASLVNNPGVVGLNKPWSQIGCYDFIGLVVDGNATIANNVAFVDGGVVYGWGDIDVNLALKGHAEMKNNSAHVNGGVVSALGYGTVSMIVAGTAVISDNHAGLHGGACYVSGPWNSSITLAVQEGARICDNRAEVSGGVIAQGSGRVDILVDGASAIKDNAALYGAVVSSMGVINITACGPDPAFAVLEGNQAVAGGVVFSEAYSPLEFPTKFVAASPYPLLVDVIPSPTDQSILDEIAIDPPQVVWLDVRNASVRGNIAGIPPVGSPGGYGFGLGGVVFSRGGPVFLNASNSVFEGNLAGPEASTQAVNGSSSSDPTTCYPQDEFVWRGGVIFSKHTVEMLAVNSTFKDNWAATDGGVVCVHGGDGGIQLKGEDSIFHNNRAGLCGGVATTERGDISVVLSGSR